jgi:protein TonB
LTIKKFIVFSIIVHIGIFLGLYFIPEEKSKKPPPFFARLVSPEEMQKAEREPFITPPPVVKKTEPSHLPRRAPVFPARPRYVPSPDKPVVPDMGKDTGQPLPQGVYPKPGAGDKGGEGGKRRSPAADDDGHIRQDKPGYSLKNKLYDPEVIGEIAMKGSEMKPKKEDSITFDTSDYRYAGYMRKLKEKIESIWVYPPEALARGLYGDLKIRFTIMKNGKLGAVDLVRTSGYKMLDDAAIKALKDGEPYWPVPEEWGMESYTILGHFVYSIYGYSLR